MGCLNDKGEFSHWFGNIHLSGPCNRHCYFCIGQHMMAVDGYNNLAKIPDNLGQFMGECKSHNVQEICVTGTNTDPLLYRCTAELLGTLRTHFACTPFAVRTNGIAYNKQVFGLYAKASVSVCSFDRSVNNQMMGGDPPDLKRILEENPLMDIKVNVVLGPENAGSDLWRTMDVCAYLGVRRVNLREPYGQPHVGDPMPYTGCLKVKDTLGMPTYNWGGVEITYWDVHYVEVESVNLYANGRVSITYPITKGYDPSGEVLPQYRFLGGRVHEQWL